MHSSRADFSSLHTQQGCALDLVSCDSVLFVICAGGGRMTDLER